MLPNNQTQIYLRANKIVKNKHITLWDPEGHLLKLCLQFQVLTSNEKDSKNNQCFEFLE